MSCYNCGSPYHKKDVCPKRIARIKCHTCNEFGHYKNDCPVNKQKSKEEREQREILQKQFMEKTDKEWFSINMPDVENINIDNLDEIRDFFVRFYNFDFGIKLYYDDCNIDLHHYRDMIYFNFGRFIKNPTLISLTSLQRHFITKFNVEQLIEFLIQKGKFKSMSFTVYRKLETMIKELTKANIIERLTEHFGKDRNDTYKLNNKIIMTIGYDKYRDTNTKIFDEYTSLICKMYDEYKKNDYSSEVDITITQYNINIVYGDKK